MCRIHRYYLILFITVFVLSGLLLFRIRGLSLDFAHAGIERICASAGFSGLGSTKEAVVEGPLEPGGELGQEITGLTIASLTRNWTQHETRFVRGLPGFMMFQNLYLHNGTLYAIATLPASIPDSSRVLCDPPIPQKDYDEHPPASAQRWQVITPQEADRRFGKQEAGVLAGTTFFFNDGPGPRGFLGHYFHFVAEAFLGAWRVHTTSPLTMEKNSANDTVFPARIMFPRGDDWRDHANLNAWFLSNVLPNTAIEDIHQWEDRAKSDSLHVFSHIIIVDRWTAHRAPGSEAQVWNKMTADIFATPAPFNWFLPLRTSIMRRLGILGNARVKTVLTYIDRQATGRKIAKEDHDALTVVLKKLEVEKEIELNMVQMEFLSKAEQIDISTRTDIMIGVHGNGLSHQIWMKPGGTILEFFDVGGFMRDYQLLSEAMHHTHYVIWNHTIYEGWRAERKTVMTENFNNVHVFAPFMYGMLGGIIDQIKISRQP